MNMLDQKGYRIIGKSEHFYKFMRQSLLRKNFCFM